MVGASAVQSVTNLIMRQVLEIIFNLNKITNFSNETLGHFWTDLLITFMFYPTPLNAM